MMASAIRCTTAVDCVGMVVERVAFCLEKTHRARSRMSTTSLITVPAEGARVVPGEKSTRVYGADAWLPEETLAAVKEYSVSIKGPMTTPVGGGIRSLNVTLRQELDLYVCLRPVRYFNGVPSPLKDPTKTDMVIFRENTEDIYAGVEWEAESDGARKLIDFLRDEMGVRKIRFPDTSGVGVKPISREGTERLVRKAIQYAIDNGRSSVTLVHKGNIMKFTEGAFRDWGYELARDEYAGRVVSEQEVWDKNDGRV